MGLLFRSKLKNPFDDKEFIFLRIQLAFIPKQFFSGSDHSPDKIVHWQNTPNISNYYRSVRFQSHQHFTLKHHKVNWVMDANGTKCLYEEKGISPPRRVLLALKVGNRVGNGFDR
ncbi:MAG TPA: hypothetical protein DCZ97_13810, partial [Syntrophus sp. (in: bacteria)]|nr:hypothetical protein [Syntrophus sp. (in: bacteria)]